MATCQPPPPPRESLTPSPPNSPALTLPQRPFHTPTPAPTAFPTASITAPPTAVTSWQLLRDCPVRPSPLQAKPCTPTTTHPCLVRSCVVGHMAKWGQVGPATSEYSPATKFGKQQEARDAHHDPNPAAWSNRRLPS